MCFHEAVREAMAKYLDRALFQNNYKYQKNVRLLILTTSSFQELQSSKQLLSY